MSVCLSYLWRFWRRKSAVFGFCIFAVIFVVGVQLTSTGSNSGRASGADNLAQAFRSTQKRLQQSESQEAEHGGVRFLPRKTIVKSLPVRPELANSIPGVHDGKYYRKASHVEKTHFVGKSVEKGFNKTNGFKENIGGVQPYAFDNTEYDALSPIVNNVAPVLPPIYKSMDLQIQQQPPDYAQYSNRGDQPPAPEIIFYVPEQRLVHFDLKGAPPKMDYLLRMLKWVKDAGATGVLLEYEEMFPFSGRLEAVAASNHYNVSDITNIVNTCQQLGLDVIPLIQTFGHMEFILKHRDFSFLRDNPDMPESICACHEKTMDLIIEYVDQVMALHPNSRSIHIGCDEVYHLGTCTQCQGLPRAHLFVNHVARVARYIKDVHKRRVIIWDDMLRGFMTAEMQPLADLVEPMVWVYAEDPYRFVPSYNWDRLAEIFPTAWTSSAYKGADGPTSTSPDIMKRLNNNLNWLQLMGIEEQKFKDGFRGIVLTGWSRYDHFAVLTELLPVAIPSLAINLLTVTHGFFNETLKSELYKRLDCADGSHLYESFIDLETDPNLWDKMAWCFFPGSQMFKLARNLEGVQVEVGNFLSKAQVEQGWLTDYNIRRNFTSPMRIDESMEDWPRVHFSVTNLIRHAQTALSEMYDEFTVGEWIEQKIYPMVAELNKLKKSSKSLKTIRHWPSRPLPILPEVREFGVGIPTTPRPKVIQAAAESQEPALSANLAGAQPALTFSDEQAPPVVHKSASPEGESSQTVRPKRLVQAPDFYRHPPGSFQSDKH